MIEFFVEQELRNTKNRRGAHWSSAARYTKRLRTATHLALHTEAVKARTDWRGAAAEPKRITLTAFVAKPFDGADGLRVALAPALDGLQPCPRPRGGPRCRHTYVILDDSDKAGHELIYQQTPDGTLRGVHVRIEEKG